jgi:dihydrofolate reductase
MRKLKLQMQVSVDGFVARPKGELDWLVWDWDEGLNQHVNALTEPVDTIVLGRVLAEGFIPAWEERLKKPENADELAFARKMLETPKVVFSRTLSESRWERTTLAKASLAEEIDRLKQASGGDIIAYGGGTFVSELIRHGLIDEFHFFINPVALGAGMTIFREPDRKVPLKLARSTSFECGIVALTYTR